MCTTHAVKSCTRTTHAIILQTSYLFNIYKGKRYIFMFLCMCFFRSHISPLAWYCDCLKFHIRFRFLCSTFFFFSDNMYVFAQIKHVVWYAVIYNTKYASLHDYCDIDDFCSVRAKKSWWMSSIIRSSVFISQKHACEVNVVIIPFGENVYQSLVEKNRGKKKKTFVGAFHRLYNIVAFWTRMSRKTTFWSPHKFLSHGKRLKIRFSC